MLDELETLNMFFESRSDKFCCVQDPEMNYKGGIMVTRSGV